MNERLYKPVSYIKTKKKGAEFWKAIYYELEQGEEIK